MQLLILGLAIFLGVHSVRIFAEGWRNARLAAMGEMAWKGVYSVVSLIGLVLIVKGYGEARLSPTLLWVSPTWAAHLAALLTLLSFVLLTAAYVPGNAIKLRLKHPMVLGVKVWALAHLLANGTLADVVLFGSFLAWAILCFRSARRREVAPAAGPASPLATALTVAIGLGAWAAFAMWGHAALIGVRPFGMMPAAGA